MSSYNWSKSKALTVAILVGFAVAAALLSLIIFVIDPAFKDPDLRMVVSMLGGMFSGWLAVQIGMAVYITKSPL